MKPKSIHVLAALLAALALGACNSTESRIDDNKKLFESYPADVQAAIRANRIEAGFDHTQVFLALGEATRTEGTAGNEKWFYQATQTRSIRQDKTASEYSDELESYEKDKKKGKDTSKPLTYRNVVQHRTRVERIVHFEDGRVTNWEEPEGQWLDDWH